MLDTLEHGFRLPPRLIVRIMDIGQIIWTVIACTVIAKGKKLPNCVDDFKWIQHHTCKRYRNSFGSSSRFVCRTLDFHFHRTYSLLSFELQKLHFQIQEYIADYEWSREKKKLWTRTESSDIMIKRVSGTKTCTNARYEIKLKKEKWTWTEMGIIRRQKNHISDKEFRIELVLVFALNHVVADTPHYRWLHFVFVSQTKSSHNFHLARARTTDSRI